MAKEEEKAEERAAEIRPVLSSLVRQSFANAPSGCHCYVADVTIHLGISGNAARPAAKELSAAPERPGT